MNSFGRLFRISVYGESHGPGIAVGVDGCPAGLRLDEGDFGADLERRKPAGHGATARREPDRPRFLSGVFNGRTTGAPLLIVIDNVDVRSEDYDFVRDSPRPGHADWTARTKFGGFNDHRGSGHFSGRVTLGLVAAGVIAKKLIRPVAIEARLTEAGGEADAERAAADAAERGDSIGGRIDGRIESVPPGLGEPFFDGLESLIAHAVLAIPAVTAIEFGAGFAAARMRGSEYNDRLVSADGRTETHHAGGINGGISNGNAIVFRVAVKPTSSIALPQTTFSFKTGRPEPLTVPGRHDACIALRVPVIVEAAAAIVVADFMLIEGKIPRVGPGD